MLTGLKNVIGGFALGLGFFVTIAGLMAIAEGRDELRPYIIPPEGVELYQAVYLYPANPKPETRTPQLTIAPTVWENNLAAADSCVVEWSGSGTEKRVRSAILFAEKRIRVAMYALTSPPLVGALILAHQNGVDVKIKLDRLQSSSKNQKAQIKRLQDAGVDVMVSGLRRVMHHKFAVIDGKLVITGSYNWTTSAERSNKENAVFMICEKTALEYEGEWEKIR